jgi:hypothetical protein
MRVTMVQMPAVNTPQLSWVLSRRSRQARPVRGVDRAGGGRRERNRHQVAELQKTAGTAIDEFTQASRRLSRDIRRSQR